jgi:hypothetical protein
LQWFIKGHFLQFSLLFVSLNILLYGKKLIISLNRNTYTGD